MPLQCTHLCWLVAAWMLSTQQGKQRCRLQGPITFQLLDDPRPVLFKGIGTRPPGAWLLHLTGQLACLLIFASCSLTHPGTCCCYLLASTFGSFFHIQLHLCVFLHDTLHLFFI